MKLSQIKRRIHGRIQKIDECSDVHRLKSYGIRCDAEIHCLGLWEGEYQWIEIDDQILALPKRICEAIEL